MLPDAASPLLLLQIAAEGHVGRAIAASDAAFHKLRKAKQLAGPDGALFELEPGGGGGGTGE